MLCTNGHEVADGKRFCQQCGEETLRANPPKCPVCWAPGDASVGFCGDCGSSVDLIRGIPTSRVAEWQTFFGDLQLLPPAVKRMMDPGASSGGNSAQVAIFRKAGVTPPGENPYEPWFLSWRVDEKQPQVTLKAVSVYEWGLREKVQAAEGVGMNPLDAVKLRNSRDQYQVIIATRTRFIAVALHRDVPSKFRTIDYVDCDSTTVDEKHLWVRVDHGPAMEITWEPPGSSFQQFVFALGAGFGGDVADRVVAARVAESHGSQLREDRATIVEAMKALADDIETVARFARTDRNPPTEGLAVSLPSGFDSAQTPVLIVCPRHGLVENPVPPGRKVSGAKIAAGLATYGLSVVATGLRKGGASWKTTSDDLYCPVRGCGLKVEIR